MTESPAPDRTEPDVPDRKGQRELGSVGNALRLLERLGHLPEAGVSELARMLGLSKPAVDRLLITLTAAGFAEQNPETRKYQLTPKIVAIAESVRSRITLGDLVRPHLMGLAAHTHETINLGILSGESVVYIDKISSDDLFRIEVRPGTMLPAYCTALGKAMLAYMPSSFIEPYLRNLTTVSFTRHTAVDRDQITRDLDEVRRDGYAVDMGELLADVCCVAAPILNAEGVAIAAISVTTPRSRFAAKRDELTKLVVESTRRIETSALPREAPTVVTYD